MTEEFEHPGDEAEDSAPALPTEFVLPESAAGTRLDTYLSRLEGAPSRNRVQQLVKDGHVTINGAEPKRSYEIHGGETVAIAWPGPQDDWPWPEAIPLDIVYHDDSVIVLNKQANLVVHPSAGNPDGTLINGLLHRFPDLPGINGVRRPGLVHRLDRDTTGLMVVAKTERAMSHLAKQFEKKTVQRRYLALVLGDPDWDKIRIEAAIGRDETNRLKRAIDGPCARHAVSHFEVLLRSSQFSLIRCQLETGRTHQIRIHAKHVGHPIVCDWIYDGHINRCLERLRPEQHALKRALVKFERPWLHSHTLRFHHLDLNAFASFQVPPPEDSAAMLRLIFGDRVDRFLGERTMQVPEAQEARDPGSGIRDPKS